jgi:hypothetical protein
MTTARRRSGHPPGTLWRRPPSLLASSASGERTTFAQELALARCMRSHGVPNFPDLNASVVRHGKRSSTDQKSRYMVTGPCGGRWPVHGAAGRARRGVITVIGYACRYAAQFAMHH